MGKISKRGGASVRVFDAPRTPADILRERGKLGPYDAARVDTFEHPDTAEPAEHELTTEPTPAQVRAWARDNDIEVSDRGKLPAELVDRYKAANPPEAGVEDLEE